MVNPTQLRNDVSQIISNGNLFCIKYFSLTDSETGYDDAQYLCQSGSDLWVSGLMQPVKSPTNSYEARLIEEGKLTTNDSRLYLLGNVNTSGMAIRIGAGSPATRQFELLPDGVEAWELGNEIVYKKLMMRVLPIGSLTNES
jgi:hypothetical protein